MNDGAIVQCTRDISDILHGASGGTFACGREQSRERQREAIVARIAANGFSMTNVS